MPGPDSNRTYWWEGASYCKSNRADGKPCGNFEIEGLEYCMHHVPLEYLDEAEGVTGIRLCRKGTGPEGICRNFAVAGTEPPQCKDHGANPGSRSHIEAGRRVLEGKVQDRFAAIMAEHGERLLNPPALGNPLTEYLALAAQAKMLKDILMERVSVMRLDDWRYQSKTMGEQIRTEIILAERAMDRLAKMLKDILSAGIEARLAAIDERQVQIVERALVLALEAAVPGQLEAQHTARQVLQRELVRAAAGQDGKKS